MSKYSIYYSGRKVMYRDMATRWSRWSETSEITEQERTGISKFFKDIGVRFGLLKEFKEIGVI
jgi:hypothetical protein